MIRLLVSRKISSRGPVGDNIWRLFNIVSDPGESDDLATQQPQRLKQMKDQYQDYAMQNGVLAVPQGYSQLEQVTLNGLRDRYGKQILLILITFLILVGFYIVYRSRRR